MELVGGDVVTDGDTWCHIGESQTPRHLVLVQARVRGEGRGGGELGGGVGELGGGR